MLKETATVVSTTSTRAKVAIVRSEACGSCPAKNMCNTASGNLNVLEVRNPANAKSGEKVVIELQPKALVRATTMLYLVPTISMVTGATLGWMRTSSDVGAMIGALAGFATATLFLYLHGRKGNSADGPAISEILAPSFVPRTRTTSPALGHDPRYVKEAGYDQGGKFKHSTPSPGA